MNTLVSVGLVELAFGALMGWPVLAKVDAPHLLTRLGVKSPRRLLQAHLDYVMMALILIAVGLAVPDLPALAQAVLLFGTLMNPTLFLPLAFDEGIREWTSYRVIAATSLVAMTVGAIAAAVAGLT